MTARLGGESGVTGGPVFGTMTSESLAAVIPPSRYLSSPGRRTTRVNKPFTPGLQIPLQHRDTVRHVSTLAIDLRRTAGYIVADRRGRLVGKVECPMYGTAPDVPDALSVRAGFLSRRRRLVPADAIDQIDGTSGVIGLRVEREAIRSFL